MPLRNRLILLVLPLFIAACGKPGVTGPQAAGTSPTPPLLLASEDVATVRNSALASGPAITGSVQPERRADLRSDVQAIVLKVLKENGDAVRKGDLLVHLDDTAIRDALASADASSRAAGLAFEQAQRQLERMEKLQKSGMTSAQAL